jgi:hypothetical protein
MQDHHFVGGHESGHSFIKNAELEWIMGWVDYTQHTFDSAGSCHKAKLHKSLLMAQGITAYLATGPLRDAAYRECRQGMQGLPIEDVYGDVARAIKLEEPLSGDESSATRVTNALHDAGYSIIGIDLSTPDGWRDLLAMIRMGAICADMTEATAYGIKETAYRLLKTILLSMRFGTVSSGVEILGYTSNLPMRDTCHGLIQLFADGLVDLEVAQPPYEGAAMFEFRGQMYKGATLVEFAKES